MERPFGVDASTQPARTIEAAGSQLTLAGGAIPRTARIQGRRAERNLPVTRPAGYGSTGTRRRSALLDHRMGFEPDRLAMWAMVLGIVLMVMALLSSSL